MDGTESANDVRDVRFDPGLAETLLGYLREAQWWERGGVLIGWREDENVNIGGVVFPPQLAQAGNHCAFDVNCIDIIRQAVTALTDRDITRIAGTIVGWVHSHPGHGLFLSRTDVETLATWAQLDDRAVAVVVDPFPKRHREQQIGWWQRAGKGRLVTFQNMGPDALTLRKACSVAEAIRDNAIGDQGWDVLASRSVIRLLPAASGFCSPRREPGPYQAGDSW